MSIPKQTMWPCTNPEIHAKVKQMLEDAVTKPSGLKLDILKIIRGDMNEMDKLAIAAGLQEMSAEDRALFKETAGEIVDILEDQFRDNKGVVMNRTEEINFDGVKTTLSQVGMVAHSEVNVSEDGESVSYSAIGNGIKLPAGDNDGDSGALTVKKIQGLAGDFEPGDEQFGNPGDLDFKGLRPRGMGAQRLVADDATFTQHVREGGPLSENLEFTVIDESNIDKILKIDNEEIHEDDPIPPVELIKGLAGDYDKCEELGSVHMDPKFRKVAMLAGDKNSAAMMMHLATQARQPGKNIDLGKALANDMLGDGGLREVERAIKNQYHPAVEHTITSDKSKHHLNAAAGWSMMNPSAHQFMWVKFYGDDTEYTIDRAVRNYNGMLQFTLSDQRVINVGAIDRHNTSLSLQNPKIRAIHIKSSRRY